MLKNNDIKEKLKYKNFDERALNYICNFVEEFDSLFGKYVNKEEIIKRIINNLDNFEFCDEFSSSKGNVVGTYSNSKKEIKISKNIDKNDEKIKSIIFHEMIHCITANPEKQVTGFSKKYFFEEDNDELNVTMHGFTEGFTEYATKIRDNKYSLAEGERISYPILTEQVQNIVSLIGEDRFFDIAFNNPKDFIEEMELEYGYVIDFRELEYLLESFETIWKEEKNIYRENNTISGGNLLLSTIFGIRTDSEELKFAKNNIIMTLEKLLLTKQITTMDEFNKLYDTMKIYTRQLNSSDNIEMYELLYDKLKDLQNGNNLISEEHIGKIDSEDFRIFVKQENYINSIKELTNKEKLMKFSKPETQEEIADYNFWENSLCGSNQRAKLSNTIIEIDSVDVGENLLCILNSGLAETILKNNWNVDKIGLEHIKLDSERTLFNLYETNINNKRYLGTYGLDEDSNFEEYTHNISNEKKEEILQEHPEFANILLLENQNGNIVGYAGNDQYIDYEGGTGEAEYCKSKEEKILEKLKSRLQRFRRLKELDVSKIILDAEFKTVKKEIDKLKEIEGESSEILEKIEKLSTDVSEQEVNEIMNEISTPKLGLEVLEIEKDFNRLDKVENAMKEHLNEHEKDLGNINELIEKKYDEIFG